jgi:hypothetical protein
MRDDSFKITCFSLSTLLFVVSFIITMSETLCSDSYYSDPKGCQTRRTEVKNEPGTIEQWHWTCDFRFMSGSVTLSSLIMDYMDYWASFHLVIIHNSGRPRGRSSSPSTVKNFLFSKSSRLTLGSTQHTIRCVPGLFPRRIKRQGREASRSPIPSAEVKKIWIYTSWHGANFVKLRHNFYLYIAKYM